MTSGIYKILNKINNKIYIGSAVSIKNRWSSHKTLLRNNCHDNIHLQYAWNKNGEENFEFSIIELCEKQDLLILEQKYLDQFASYDRKNGYNIAKIAGNTFGCFHSEDSRLKIKQNNKASTQEVRKRMKEYWANPENRKHQGEKRKIFLSKEENRKALSNSIKKHYKDNPDKILIGEKNPLFGIKPVSTKQIERIDPITGEIKEYTSIRDTSKDGFEYSVVAKVCKGKLKSHKGYYWKYKED